MTSIDDSTAMEEFHLQQSLKVRKRSLEPVGYCHFCSSELETGVFCDQDCSNDYEKQLNIKIIAGNI